MDATSKSTLQNTCSYHSLSTRTIQSLHGNSVEIEGNLLLDHGIFPHGVLLSVQYVIFLSLTEIAAQKQVLRATILVFSVYNKTTYIEVQL